MQSVTSHQNTWCVSHSLSVFSPHAEMSSFSTASTQSFHVFPVRRAPGLHVLLGLCDPRTCPTSSHVAPWCWQELPSVQLRLRATAIDHTDKQANVAAGVQRLSAMELRPAGRLPFHPHPYPHPTTLQLCVQFTTKIYLFWYVPWQTQQQSLPHIVCLCL